MAEHEHVKIWKGMKIHECEFEHASTKWKRMGEYGEAKQKRAIGKNRESTKE